MDKLTDKVKEAWDVFWVGRELYDARERMRAKGLDVSFTDIHRVDLFGQGKENYITIPICQCRSKLLDSEEFNETGVVVEYHLSTNLNPRGEHVYAYFVDDKKIKETRRTMLYTSPPRY